MAAQTKHKREPERDYQVGYCRPPAAHRFKPGQSGNPAGRKKQAPKSLAVMLTELLTETIIVQANGKPTRMMRWQVMLKVAKAQAAKKDRLALAALHRLGKLTGYFEPEVIDAKQVGYLVVEKPCATHEEWERKFGYLREAAEKFSNPDWLGGFST